jgi:hypothetical protein
MKRKTVLKQWVHAIRRKKLPMTKNTNICSQHFVNASKRLLRVDEVPTRHLPLTVEVRVLAESSINLQPCLDEQLKILEC